MSYWYHLPFVKDIDENLARPRVLVGNSHLGLEASSLIDPGTLRSPEQGLRAQQTSPSAATALPVADSRDVFPAGDLLQFLCSPLGPKLKTALPHPAGGLAYVRD